MNISDYHDFFNALNPIIRYFPVFGDPVFQAILENPFIKNGVGFCP